MATPQEKHWSGTTVEEWKQLFSSTGQGNVLTKIGFFILVLIIGPIGLLGALLGYVRGYNRFMRPKGRAPEFTNLPAIVKWSMAVFAVVFCVAIALLAYYQQSVDRHGVWVFLLIPYLISLALSGVVYFFFNVWRNGVNAIQLEGEKFGTARFASVEELTPYHNKQGIYAGGGYCFADKGHLLTVAGTRGGKGTNLIIPNLLGVGGYQGSWVVIDPKGENAAITARYQRESGKNVVILNPWGLHHEILGTSASYNPLDILADGNSQHLVDDAQVIAEMIVPIDSHDRDRFFSDSARAIVAGLLLHLITSQPKEMRHLGTLWRWVRLSGDAWVELIADMHVNDDPLHGDVVKAAADEILKMTEAGDKTFGSIMATILQCTDFLKSQALLQCLVSGYDPAQLSDGNTALYIIIPADKLQSHARWLRLAVTSTMRAVVRRPNKNVAFLLDEFAALGYLSEIETALSTYAGFNITVWPILQSLAQLKKHYHDDNWESFIGNTAVRQFFSINDNFTAEYVSKAIGRTTNVVYERRWFKITKIESNARELVTPDELRRTSGKEIFAFFGSIPPTYYPKRPYYEVPGLLDRADKNPYVE